MKDIKLNNETFIPQIGLGTWLISNDEVYDAYMNALKVGYRHFDSAQDYMNEENLGKAINDCGISRESLYITSKVASHQKSYDDAKKSIEISLEKLNTPYIDLMLIHCPTPWKEYNPRTKTYYKENVEVWRALEEFVKLGKIKSIGVSNFNKDDIENILKNCSIKPVINQIPVYIGNTDLDLISYCLRNNIQVEAYSPIAHGRLLNNKEALNIANKYHCSIAQLCIQYTIQLGLISLPKTINIEHMKENIHLDFEISKEDMDILIKIKE